ncbi:hypothetical protein RSK20926_15321 [Roseobacter sp. SK209-2-6]|nr:hypothetical protein RSK20926_15321 [Roseobacter sp. SK209-2-6]
MHLHVFAGAHKTTDENASPAPIQGKPSTNLNLGD